MKKFQSTSPVWGMTTTGAVSSRSKTISIHIPRVGDDQKQAASLTVHVVFQSTSPVWGMTL